MSSHVHILHFSSRPLISHPSSLVMAIQPLTLQLIFEDTAETFRHLQTLDLIKGLLSNISDFLDDQPYVAGQIVKDTSAHVSGSHANAPSCSSSSTTSGHPPSFACVGLEFLIIIWRCSMWPILSSLLLQLASPCDNCATRLRSRENIAALVRVFAEPHWSDHMQCTMVHREENPISESFVKLQKRNDKIHNQAAPRRSSRWKVVEQLTAFYQCWLSDLVWSCLTLCDLV